MIEILLLALIPAAAWAGWILAKSTTSRGERKRNRNFSHRYFQGLNYLLDEQPDKAIAVFIEMAEVTADTIETHLALGSLFRRAAVTSDCRMPNVSCAAATCQACRVLQP